VNKVTCKTIFASLLFFVVAHICAADTESRAKNARRLAGDVQRSLPFTVLMPLAWSDSYIGQFVSRKPHFGGGVSYGMAKTDFSALRDLLGDLREVAYMDTGGVMTPPMYGYARIGGFFIPFDIGVMASIPLNSEPANGFVLEQQSIGGDIRFALSRDESKSPGVSLGIAYAQTTGRLLTEASGRNIGIHWSANAAEIKVQVSKTLQAFTPYFGGGGSFTWSTAGYDVTGTLTEAWGKEPDNFENGVLFRLFGGTSVKLWLFRLDFNVNVSIPDFEYGVIIGARLQT
jgi:hypothetical protein